MPSLAKAKVEAEHAEVLSPIEESFSFFVPGLSIGVESFDKGGFSYTQDSLAS